MDETLQKPDPNEEYAGPSRAVTVLGYAEKYSIFGAVIGAVVGLAGSEGLARQFPWMVEKATKWMARFNVAEHSKTAVRVGGFLGGGIIGHYGGLGYGFLKWGGYGREGREQFDRIKGERDNALARVDSLETTLATKAVNEAEQHKQHASHSAHFTEHHAARSEHGSYAAVHAAEKQTADMSEHIRG